MRRFNSNTWEHEIITNLLPWQQTAPKLLWWGHLPVLLIFFGGQFCLWRHCPPIREQSSSGRKRAGLFSVGSLRIRWFSPKIVKSLIFTTEIYHCKQAHACKYYATILSRFTDSYGESRKSSKETVKLVNSCVSITLIIEVPKQRVLKKIFC